MRRGAEQGKKRRKRKLRWGRVFLVIFLPVGILGLAYIYQCWDIWRFSKESAKGNADAAVVLGAAAWGPKPSPVFAARLDHAADMYLDGRVKKIIVTGGVGRLGGPSEAEVGKRYLARHGVDAVDVIEENQSRRTFDNLLNAERLMEEANLDNCMVVSDPLHMKRSIVMAKVLGIKAESSPTHTSAYKSQSEKLKFLMREGWFMLGYRMGLVR